MTSFISKSLITKALVLSLVVGGAAVTARAEISEKDFAAAMERYLKSDSGSTQFIDLMQGMQAKQMELAKKKQAEKAQAQIEDQLKNPVSVDVGSSPVKGPANAPVTLIEFSDFQCPYCKKGHDVVDEVLKAYPNQVKVVFKHFPLPFHPQAKPAAMAAFAAGKQGKFWEFYDAMFAQQDKLGKDMFIAEAKQLGLNMEKFEKDMASPEAEAQLKADGEAAQKIGINGTPGFVVGGVQVNGAYPFEHFKSIIDRILATKK